MKISPEKKMWRGMNAAMVAWVLGVTILTGCIGDAGSTLGEPPIAWQEIPHTGEKFDVAITDVSVTFTSMEMKVVATLSNVGTRTTGASDMRFWINRAEAPLKTDTDYDYHYKSWYYLEPGKSMTVQTISLPYTEFSGTAYVVVIHDETAPDLGPETNKSNNIGSYSWNSPPDLVATIGSATHDETNLTVNYTISNVGGSDAGPFHLAVWGNHNSTYQFPSLTDVDHDAEESITGLAVGEQTTGSVQIPMASTGSGLAWVFVDHGGEVLEMDEKNGTSFDWKIDRDLVGSIEGAITTTGTVVSMNYKVTNQGTLAAGPFEVALLADYDSGDYKTEFPSQKVFSSDGLAAGESITFSTPVDVGIYSGKIKITLDSQKQVVEGSEVNNLLEGKYFSSVVWDEDFASYYFASNGWGGGDSYTTKLVYTPAAPTWGYASGYQMTGGNNTPYDGKYHVFADPGVAPKRIAFWVYAEATTKDCGYFTLRKGNVDVFTFHFGEDGNLYMNRATQGTYQPTRWYLVAFENIDWNAHTFTLKVTDSVDNLSTSTSVDMSTKDASITSITSIDLYNISPDSTVYWDNIIFNN